jgi:rSAM/selenodomain-associated transferase 2
MVRRFLNCCRATAKRNGHEVPRRVNSGKHCRDARADACHYDEHDALESILCKSAKPSMRWSVIIPTLNEETLLPETLRHLRREKPKEIVVVDGGSSDATVALARQQADVVLSGPRGRAVQMNWGAAHARGEFLLFLHADCTLEEGALQEASTWLQRDWVAGGCFQMSIPRRHRLYRSIAACATARVKLTGIVYGDQGLFVRRDLFEKLGGFPPIRLMEDVFFSQKLRRHGRIVVARRQIEVSARRWEHAGIVRQTLRNWALTAAALCGIHPDRLACWYPVVRS